MIKNFLLLLVCFEISSAFSIKMCDTCQISSLSEAFKILKSGDTLLIEDGVYSGGNYYSELKGNKDHWINIIGNPKKVIFEGENTAFQISDFEYVRFEGITIQNQKLNGVNVDDAGTFETPAHHIIFSNCLFRDIDNTGNNDLLKLSGLDTFLIESCTFSGGANGGSGADMVGCHSGTFSQNYFEDMGNNAIQCKGGTSEILIERNMFVNAGLRGINLGGSTALDFFRPQGASYEARNLKVYSNVFIGCQAAIAYVVSENVEVINNTIIKPDKWIFRILQEQQDFDRFIKTRNNSFINNLVLVDDKLSTFEAINIGANTLPETFDFSNNIWFHTNDASWMPNIPTNSQTEIFLDPKLDNYTPNDNSPAKSAGKVLSDPKYDFNGNLFAQNRSIGAIEIADEVIKSINKIEKLDYFVNGNTISINSPVKISNIKIYNIIGDIISASNFNSNNANMMLASGLNLIIIELANGDIETLKIIK